MKENLTVKEVLKVFDGSLPPGKAKDQPCCHSDAFCYITEGEIEYTFSGKICTAKEKSLIFFPKGSAYSLNILSPLKYICIDFNFESGSGLTDGVVFNNIPPATGNEFLKLLKIYLVKSPWYNPSLFSGVYRIYSEILKAENAKYMPLASTFSGITSFILENYLNPDFSVSMLSEKFGISEVHIRRIFRSAAKTSPKLPAWPAPLKRQKPCFPKQALKYPKLPYKPAFPTAFIFHGYLKKKQGFPLLLSGKTFRDFLFKAFLKSTRCHPRIIFEGFDKGV